MATCIHGNLCKSIWDKHHFIYSRNCPKECPFFEKKKNTKRNSKSKYKANSEVE